MKRDSYYVQCVSLEAFMSRLGYSPVASAKGVVFQGRYSELNAYAVISFQNAVNLHNKANTAVQNGDVMLVTGTSFKFPTYLFRQALAAKIVEKVHLCLREKKVYTDKAWVKFMNNSQSVFYRVLGEELPEVDLTNPELYEE